MWDRILQWWTLFQQGGPLMYLIFLCSVTTLAIILERFWMLRKVKVLPEETVREAESLLKSGDLGKARAALVAGDSSVSRVLAAGIDRAGKDRESIKTAMEDAGRVEAHQLSQFVNMLGGIAGLAPLLGLLGTVIGMIQAFNDIVKHGVGSAGDVAGGISMALITTAAGLTVAIPAFIANRYFAGRVDNLLARMEEIAMRFTDLIRSAPVKDDGEVEE